MKRDKIKPAHESRTDIDYVYSTWREYGLALNRGDSGAADIWRKDVLRYCREIERTLRLIQSEVTRDGK